MPRYAAKVDKWYTTGIRRYTCDKDDGFTYASASRMATFGSRSSGHIRARASSTDSRSVQGCLMAGMSLGSLCKRGHDHDGTGLSMRYASGHCAECENQRRRLSGPSARGPRTHVKTLDEKKEQAARYNAEHRDERRHYGRERYRTNEAYRERAKERRASNPERYRTIQRESKQRARVADPQAVRDYMHEYYRKNSLRIRLRTRLVKAFKMFSQSGKTMSSDDYIDYAAVIAHLGPCPGTSREWHVDHIRPLSSFDFDDAKQVKEAFAARNHQWLPAKENLMKASKIATAR